MPYYVRATQDPDERAVQAAGYRWVSTTRLGPGGELGAHQHHSDNTHYVTQGSLEITPVVQDADSLQRVTLTADHLKDHDRREQQIRPGVTYRGKAGSQGAHFVEGHSVLSVASADRFERRGDIIWVDDGSGITKEQWFAQERQQGTKEGTHVEPVNRPNSH